MHEMQGPLTFNKRGVPIGLPCAGIEACDVRVAPGGDAALQDV